MTVYAASMSKPKLRRGPGRPKSDQSDSLTQRHVVNMTLALENAIRQFQKEHGVSQFTEATRMILIQAMKAEGKL